MSQNLTSGEGGATGDMTRSRWTKFAMVALPILANVVLGAVIWTHLPPGATVGGSFLSDPIPIGPTSYHGSKLPIDGIDAIVEAVERTSGRAYRCEGPWLASGGVLKWACRTDDALVIVVGTSNGEIFLIEGTWFGFDRSATDLPAWAAAAQADPNLASVSRDWADGAIGSAGSTTIGRVQLEADGARGAYTLKIVAQ